MASITFTADQTILDELVLATCATYNYQATIDGAPNPVTPGQFTSNVVISFCKQIVMSYEAQKAAEAARQQALATLSQKLDSTPIQVSLS